MTISLEGFKVIFEPIDLDPYICELGYGFLHDKSGGCNFPGLTATDTIFSGVTSEGYSCDYCAYPNCIRYRYSDEDYYPLATEDRKIELLFNGPFIIDIGVTFDFLWAGLGRSYLGLTYEMFYLFDGTWTPSATGYVGDSQSGYETASILLTLPEPEAPFFWTNKVRTSEVI